MGAIGLAGREQLDNLIWVVNCNLQRLDGPVRGNGKIIQELESDFRGAGWNVIKVIWGSRWDPLLAADTDGRAGEGDGGVRRRRVPDVQVARRRVRARALLRPRPGAARARRAHVRRRDLAAQPRRPRPAEGLRRLPRGGPAHRPADGDPRQDDQGLRDGRLRRGPDDHPPGQEDDRGRAARVPRPVRAAADRRAGARGRVLQAARGLARDAVPARAPRGARRLACRRAGARREPLAGAAARAVPVAARGHRRARDLDHDGVRAHPRRAAARQADRPPHRPDRARRVAHVRDGGHVPPGRDLLAGRPALPARRTPSS